jgi:hypothetical protein
MPSILEDKLLSAITTHYKGRGFPRRARDRLEDAVKKHIRDDSIVFDDDLKLNVKVQKVINYFRRHRKPTPALANIVGVDAIFAFSWGYRLKSRSGSSTIIRLPGRNNRRLGEIAVKLKQEFDVPLYAQFEIADAIEDSEDDKCLHPDYRSPIADIGTKEVIDCFVDHRKVEKRHEFKKVIAVAHRHHVNRCIIILKEDFDIESSWCNKPRPYGEYDPREGQPRASSPEENIVSDFVSMGDRAKRLG